jgi:ParB-like nuclease domain
MFIPLSTQRFSSPASEFLPGPAPFLEWIETDKLVVDVTYQREIGRRGATNVNQIAENLDWSKFAPVIVAPVEGGQFAIVDGQHRTTAAILLGQEKVPCQVVQADRAKQLPPTPPSTAILRKRPLNSCIMRNWQQKTRTLWRLPLFVQLLMSRY